MLKRMLVMLVAVTICATMLTCCGSKKDEPTKAEKASDLAFSDVKVECNSRDGFFGGRYAHFRVSASVKNESENPVNEDNMPELLSDDGKTEIKPDLSQDKLLHGETCNISYEHEFDVKHDSLPKLSFSCKLSYNGLEDAEKEIDEGLKKVLNDYADEDTKKEKEKEAAEAKKEEAKKSVEACKGKTADEGLKAADVAGYSAKFKESKGVEVTSKVKDSSNKSDVHVAKITEVKLGESFGQTSVEFTLDYIDPDAQKEREAKETKEAAEKEQKAQEDVVINAENNEEFAELLTVGDPGDPLVAEFANKYAGRKIEFDGVVTACAPHGSFKTRFDYLINVGDDPETATVGPNFKLEDVNFSDFKWKGSSPDSVPVGTMLHCVMKIDKYKDTPQLLFVKPVETSIR